jgi:hypothetical protein
MTGDWRGAALDRGQEPRSTFSRRVYGHKSFLTGGSHKLPMASFVSRVREIIIRFGRGAEHRRG